MLDQTGDGLPTALTDLTALDRLIRDSLCSSQTWASLHSWVAQPALLMAACGITLMLASLVFALFQYRRKPEGGASR